MCCGGWSPSIGNWSLVSRHWRSCATVLFGHLSLCLALSDLAADGNSLFLNWSGSGKTKSLQEWLFWRRSWFQSIGLLFIFTVSAGHVMEASLGYYINPLVNVLLATVFERTVESVGDDCLWFGSCWSDHAFGANWCDPLCFTDHGFSFSTYGLIKNTYQSVLQRD